MRVSDLKKNPYARFLLPSLARRYFNRRRKMFFGEQVVPLKHVDIWMLRADHRGSKRSFVAIYDLYSGRRERRRVVGLAHEDGSRLTEHAVTSRFAEIMQSDATFVVPAPIHYDHNFGISFTEHIPGRVLNDIIEEEKRIPAPILKSTTRWLKTLQTISVPTTDLPHRQPSFGPFKKNLKTALKRAPEFAAKVTRSWNRFEIWYARESKRMPHVLSHGDYHPWNIKVLPGTEQVGVYDFGLVTKAPRHWDLASFLAQIESINHIWLPLEKLRRIQEDVLASWEREVSPLSGREIREIENLKRYFDLSAIVYLIAWGEPWKDYERIVKLYDQLP